MKGTGYVCPMVRLIFTVVVSLWSAASLAQEQNLELEPVWEYVSDRVMGGVSSGELVLPTAGAEQVARLTGAVSLDNNGGFVQMAFNLGPDGGSFDASSWRGLVFEARGNGETYDIRLRTSALYRPWQSFRTEFVAPLAWTSIQVPFDTLKAHRTETAFTPADLRRVGILAIGRVFDADVSIRLVQLYK